MITAMPRITFAMRRWCERQFVYSLIPIVAMSLFPMFGFYAVRIPDSRRDTFLFPQHRVKKTKCNVVLSSPGLCIAVVSCNRSDYLHLVLARLFELIIKSEPDLLYELIWIDQGMVNHQSLSQLYHFDKKFFFVKPVGYFASFRLAFSECTRDYLFVLKDDWLPMNISLPWFSFSMDLLAHAPESICAILLCLASVHNQIYRTAIRSCLVPSGTVWRFAHNFFYFTNLPTVYRMSSLKHISASYDYINEYDFAARARVMKYTLSLWVDGMTRPEHGPIRFLHLGVPRRKYKTILFDNTKADN
jgi:hypothetical protein